MSRWRRALLGVVALGLAGLLVWVAAPVDLLPSWASWGSVGEMKSTVVGVDALGNKTITAIDYAFPEGFARGLTGVRLDDVAQRVREYQGSATYQVVSNNFVSQPGDASANMFRLDFTVVLGRIVRTTVG